MSVQFVDACYAPAERDEAEGLTWQVQSHGVLGTPGVETTGVQFADATPIGVSWDTRVRELAIRPCREVSGKETVALPISAQTARSVAESLICYGLDERLSKRVAADFIVEAEHQCTDLSIPLYAANGGSGLHPLSLRPYPCGSASVGDGPILAK